MEIKETEETGGRYSVMEIKETDAEDEEQLDEEDVDEQMFIFPKRKNGEEIEEQDVDVDADLQEKELLNEMQEK